MTDTITKYVIQRRAADTGEWYDHAITYDQTRAGELLAADTNDDYHVRLIRRGEEILHTNNPALRR